MSLVNEPLIIIEQDAGGASIAGGIEKMSSGSRVGPFPCPNGEAISSVGNVTVDRWKGSLT